MILSDREIRAAIGRRSINISPIPQPEAWTSTAIDLTLAKELVVWNLPQQHGVESVISPSHPDYNFDAVREQYSKNLEIAADGYVFKPQTFLLGWTIEKIQLPHRSRIAARVEGKSSLARLGIGVHITAPTIHSGFGYRPGDDNFQGSPLQLEMWNAGPLNVKLVAGMSICQLIFEIVDGTPEKGYQGQFSIQGPKLRE
ncbi:MAG: dCTP deaminase [Planctomycetaceae bacterium]